MHARFVSRSRRPSAGVLARLLRLAALGLPSVLLLVAALRAPGEMATLLWLGALFQLLGCLLAVAARQGWRDPLGPAVIMLYVIALSWLVFTTAGTDDWFLHLAQAVLLVLPLGFFGVQCLRDSGAITLRKARGLARRLANRVSWPADLGECRALPEVKALRESLHVDASPALELLTHPRAQVRVAALSALEFRENWRSGQPQLVLHLAQRASEPEVRAAAVNALANTEDRVLGETLAGFLADPSPLVRQTTIDALLWNTEGRWLWLRTHVRLALSNPSYMDDGAVRITGGRWGPDAIADLHSWAAEKGVLSQRAAQTLGVHYGGELTNGADPKLVGRLRQQLLDPHTPPMLRLELARLLHQHHELDVEALRRLLGPSMPAPVRLIAVEALLAKGHSPEALAALHELARLPNREIALATADVVQRRVGVDLGLPRGGMAPPVHSRLAAEIARRVLHWAAQDGAPNGVPADLSEHGWA